MKILKVLFALSDTTIRISDKLDLSIVKMKREARRGRNPQTGEEIQIPAKKVSKFVPGKGLREKVG